MSDNQPVLIKKVKKVSGGGHHGGAWKVAYADFVTAMMAFFLLMWLINTTSPDQKRGIADYFAPASVSRSAQGSDGMLGGTAFEDEGARSGGAQRPLPRIKASERSRARRKQEESSKLSEADLDKAIANREKAQFASAEQSLRQAMLDLPELAELSRHLIVDQTPEGLRIQLVDQEGRAMFARSSSEPLARMRTLMGSVARILDRLPNRISISGHTTSRSESSEGLGYSGWDLSSERAQAARRLLEQAGVSDQRIYEVSGKSDTDPLFVDDPDLPGNRRVSIVLLREVPVIPDGHGLSP